MITINNDIQVYENEIDKYIQIYCEQYNIQDIKKESMFTWNSILLFIGKNVFKNKNRDANSLSNRDKSVLDYNNIDLIDELVDYYINLCYMYSKEVSIMGFSKFSNIDRSTLISWNSNDTRKSNKKYSLVVQKLLIEREESLQNALFQPHHNVVGVIAMLNHHYGYNQTTNNLLGESEQQKPVEQIKQDYADYKELPTMPINDD